MRLNAYGLTLNMKFGKPAHEGRLDCSVILDVPGFHGKFGCQLMQSDLEEFQSQLALAIDSFGESMKVRFATSEPGIDLFFTVNPDGKVRGAYGFRNFGAPGSPALNGSFIMEKTALRLLLSEVERHLKAMD